MNITIVGAGNVGTQFAVHCAEKWHKVTIYGSQPEKINKELKTINENDKVIHRGTIEKATNSETEECCKIVEGLLDIKTSPLPNYLNITLTPSNPILHTHD